MKTDYPSALYLTAEQSEQEPQDEAPEVDEADIPILFEAIEPEPEEHASETGAPNEKHQDAVVTLSLEDALLDDDESVEHQAPLSDPLDEDGKRHSSSKESDQAQLAAMVAIVAQGGGVGSTDEDAPAPDQESTTAGAPEAPVAIQDPAASVNSTHPPFASVGDTGAQPQAKKTENPFLPQHILDRLNQGRRNLVEEIAQSSAALDASTARLRSRTRSDRFERINAQSEPLSDAARTRARDQLVDELVQEFLPLVAAELRRRLKRMLKD